MAGWWITVVIGASGILLSFLGAATALTAPANNPVGYWYEARVAALFAISIYIIFELAPRLQ